jgi:hypothetical protein
MGRTPGGGCHVETVESLVTVPMTAS